MQDFVKVDKQCASALLEAWRRNDSALMSEFAALANLGINDCHETDPADAERLELLGAIAVELHKAASRSRKEEADPYVRLLIHLAKPDQPCHRTAHRN